MNNKTTYYGTTIDKADRLAACASQLDAMLIHAYGESGDAMRRLNDGLQDAYMWACSDLASEIRELASEFRLVPEVPT